MKTPCGAVLASVAVSWGAATPVTAAEDLSSATGPFQIDAEIDADAMLALSDPQGVTGDPKFDLRFRADAEAVTADGWRWGASFDAGARNQDGRRGLQGGPGDATGPAGLITGLGGAGLQDHAVLGFTRAELFVKSSLFEAFIGHGPTAAEQAQIQSAHALRLTRADGALVDPLGAGLVDTGLSLTSPALRVSLQTRRLVGIALSASFTPEGDVCGLERCLNAAYGHVDQIVTAAAGFDRRAGRDGARWRISARGEAGQAVAGPLSGDLSDPWLVGFQISRDLDGLTVEVAAISARDGLQGAEYTAWSARTAMETGNWLFDAEIGRAFSDAARRAGWTAQAGVSRLVGRRGLAGAAIQVQDAGGGAALIAEAGLRF
jgi:hypothetical protein